MRQLYISVVEKPADMKSKWTLKNPRNRIILMDLGAGGTLRLIETVINVSPRLSDCNGGENGEGGVIKKV